MSNENIISRREFLKSTVLTAVVLGGGSFIDNLSDYTEAGSNAVTTVPQSRLALDDDPLQGAVGEEPSLKSMRKDPSVTKMRYVLVTEKDRKFEIESESVFDGLFIAKNTLVVPKKQFEDVNGSSYEFFGDGDNLTLQTIVDKDGKAVATAINPSYMEKVADSYFDGGKVVKTIEEYNFGLQGEDASQMLITALPKKLGYPVILKEKASGRPLFSIIDANYGLFTDENDRPVLLPAFSSPSELARLFRLQVNLENVGPITFEESPNGPRTLTGRLRVAFLEAQDGNTGVFHQFIGSLGTEPYGVRFPSPPQRLMPTQQEGDAKD